MPAASSGKQSILSGKNKQKKQKKAVIFYNVVKSASTKIYIVFIIVFVFIFLGSKINIVFFSYFLKTLQFTHTSLVINFLPHVAYC